MAIYQNSKIAGNKTLYISGQTPSKDNSTPDTIAEQMDIVIKKIAATLEEYDLTADDLVKINIYITDTAYLQTVREKLAEFVGDSKPTATLVVVAGLIDPAFKIEIDGIATF